MTRFDLSESGRGVSDVIAFTLVFSIIITSVALVYATGFSSITQISEGEQKTNSVRAFEALDLSFDDLTNGKANRRGSTINLGGGRLQVADGPDIIIEVDEGQTGTVNWDYSDNTGTFEYALEDSSVSWENGGIFREDRGASVNLGRTEMVCSSNRAVVSIVLLRSDSGAIGADGNVEITMSVRSKELVYADYDDTSPKDVTVTIHNSAYDDAWDRHMDQEMGWDLAGSDYECNGKDEVIVRITVIDVEYDTP